MVSMQEFNDTYDNFRKIYEECSSLISSGVELETVDEDAVINSIHNSRIIKSKAISFTGAHIL